MTKGAHIGIGTSEDVVIRGTGVGGVDEAGHSFGIVLGGTENATVMVTSTGIIIGTDGLPVLQGGICLRQLSAVGIRLSDRAETVRFGNNGLGFMERTMRTGKAEKRAKQEGNMGSEIYDWAIYDFFSPYSRTICFAV